MTPPKQLYLQWYGDVSEEEVAELDVDPKHVAADDTTWAEDKIYNSDCGPYILAEDYNKLREQLAAVTAQRDRAMELCEAFADHWPLCYAQKYYALKGEIEKEAEQ